MQLQLNTDHELTGSASLAARLQADVDAALDRFAERITRVEMHLNDVNGGDKAGPDKRCQIEARVAGRPPVSVNHVAPDLQVAVDGALDKLVRALDRAFGKLDANRRRAPHHGMGDAVGAEDLASAPLPPTDGPAVPTASPDDGGTR
jgi:ribosome-associated translation inhibitor RaiA